MFPDNIKTTTVLLTTNPVFCPGPIFRCNGMKFLIWDGERQDWMEELEFYIPCILPTQSSWSGRWSEYQVTGILLGSVLWSWNSKLVMGPRNIPSIFRLEKSNMSRLLQTLAETRMDFDHTDPWNSSQQTMWVFSSHFISFIVMRSCNLWNLIFGPHFFSYNGGYCTCKRIVNWGESIVCYLGMR